MKIKIIIIFFLSIIFSFFIYNLFYKDEINYLAIGDEITNGITPFNNYGKSYTDFFNNYLENKYKKVNYNTILVKENLKIEDIIEYMNDKKNFIYNKTNYNINQMINKSDVITINFGQNKIYEYLSSKRDINTYTDDLYDKYNTLINNIISISDAKIYIIGYYNPLYNVNIDRLKNTNLLIEKINEKFKNLKKVNFVNIYPEINEKINYLPNDKYPYPSLEGYNYISNKIIETYEKG